ncbi:MAG: xanthine dehydrogenase family protein subunit M [Geminicoccaceae bacterium]|nr:xanthine dehydrogenase family protein subunit M [Geminicoccaceae bacterium]
MIPPPFDYHRPRSLAEATGLLARLGEEARPIAGGHSLLPMMKLRLASPAHLVDLGELAELRGLEIGPARVRIGAMLTQREIVASEPLAEALPILRETALRIADPQVRARGTIGGNLANGDPGNDLPAVMLALDATYLLAGAGGERRVPARGFYAAAYVTALEPGEILTAVEIPRPAVGHGWAYEKLKRKVGDYATAAAAALLEVEGGRVARCAIGLTNLADTPLLAEAAAAAVIGSELGPEVLAEAAAEAEAITDPASDGRGPAAYRRKVGGVMVRRALEKAWARATGRGPAPGATP